MSSLKVFVFVVIYSLMLPSWRYNWSKLDYVWTISNYIIYWSEYEGWDLPQIDPVFVAVFMKFESGYINLNPKNKRKPVGLLQIVPGGVASFGFSREQLLQPEYNIQAGVRYLRQGLKRCGNLKSVIGYYRYWGGPCNKFGPRERYVYSFYRKVKSSLNSLTLRCGGKCLVFLLEEIK